MKKQWIWRGSIYAVGIFLLALSATFGTKTGLGISPITSMPFAISYTSGIPFAVSVFVFHSACVVVEFLVRGKHRQWRDLLQVPFSLAFSTLLGAFDNAVPMCDGPIWQRFLLLATAIVLNGVGIAMVVNMQLVPNPPDGMIQSISWRAKKDIGLCKNITDISLVCVSFLIDVLFGTIWTSVGIGTVVFSLLCGRVVFFFNRYFRKKIMSLAGLQEASNYKD